MKNVIGVCMGIACKEKGSIEIFEYISDKLGISFNETTENGEYSIKPVRCLGDCANAPIAMFNGELIKKATIDDIKAKIG